MRVNIYIPTKELHDSMKAQAGREGRSLSDYLLHIHKEHLGCLGNSKWEDSQDTSENGDKQTSFFKPNPKKE